MLWEAAQIGASAAGVVMGAPLWVPGPERCKNVSHTKVQFLDMGHTKNR